MSGMAVTVRSLPRAGTRQDGALRDILGDAALIGTLTGAAFLATLVGQPALARLGFLLGAVGLAVWLVATGRLSSYVLFCLWLFVVTPWLRRYIDVLAGWQQVSTVMLAPWLAAACSLVMLLRAVTGPTFPMAYGVLLIGVTATYGLFIAAFGGRLSSAGFDWLRWVVPPCFAALAVTAARADGQLGARLLGFFTVSVALTGLYGLWQFVVAPPWDVYWMVNSQMGSIGEPKPFMIRVFSLLNSPGPFANFLTVGLLLLFVFATPLRAAAAALGFIGLLLSQGRAAWGAIAVAAAFLVLVGPVQVKARAAMVIGAVCLAMPVAFSIQEVALIINDRIDSLRFMAGDTSYHERVDAYLVFIESLGTHIMGQGLAVNGAFQSYGDGKPVQYIDGQPIEVYLALGIIGGTVYFAGAFSTLWQTATAGLRVGGGHGLAATAIALAAVVSLPYGSPLIGESGIFFWLCCVFCHVSASGQPRR